MSWASGQNTIKKYASIVAVTLALVFLLVYMQGGFVSKVAPGTNSLTGETRTQASHTAVVAQELVGDMLAWPGTVKSRTVAGIAPRLTALITEIYVNAGDAVKKGDVIARLDERDLRAREKAALAALAGADAHAVRASADKQRISSLFEKEAATRESYDAAVAQAKEARARADQAAGTLHEIRTRLTDTLLRAPFDGIVVKRLKQPGDMGLPGVPVVTLQIPHGLRLEIEIPAACAGEFGVGEKVTVRIDTLNQTFSAPVDEIIPEMDAQTHSQLIKIGLPAIEGLKPGHFGWLEQACGQHVALLIPVSAVQYLGQLEIVRVLSDGRQSMRHIRTGKTIGDRIEVISGLRAGEIVMTGSIQPQ
ncbi:efflux RND transporter periplasmic adaptor subunit [Nitrosomonas marina]|uniref:RND family efflux transporter, MFP subunit n=1 Tax=Nitrosomonas marina TaxID=917 RepID=A0A1H8AIX6_9PROT|nr:efflux RND transporter periplasmic adaptor subunit [Nitrosomonas marina]SEM70752.1 RND family efflux transporter, MFP subunit [Nitrosomonas marina]